MLVFEDFGAASLAFLLAGFVIAFVMGALVNKTNFCTMGAVSDWVNMGDKGRLYAWIFAIAIAMFGVAVLEYLGQVNASSTFPPYRSSELLLGEHILGGILFGIGMTLASGCGNKSLVRVGGGNIKSIFVLIIIGVVAFYMSNPFPGTDKTLMSVLFYDWLRPLSVSLSHPQDLASFVSSDNTPLIRLIFGVILSLALMTLVFRAKIFTDHKDNIIGGLVVGLAVLLAWWFTSNVIIAKDGESFHIANYVSEQWDMFEETEGNKPLASRTLSAQSFTFVNPTAQTFGYVASGFKSTILSFGVLAVFGVILGSFFMSLISKTFRIEWFVNFKDFAMHAVGAVLMGLGATLALGCTIGQAVSGVSTLALGSFITTLMIVLASTLTMKIQYYKIVYEEEATFIKALVAGMADLKMLPNSLRKLDKV